MLPGRFPGVLAVTQTNAQELSGLHFTDAEAAMALPGALRNRDSFEALRRLDIPLDTEPAIAFHPYLPGKRPKGRSTRNAVLRVTQKSVRVTSRLDDLAYEPVTVLSALVRFIVPVRLRCTQSLSHVIF